MAKNAFTDWSTTAASNTDIGGIGIQGTDPPSNFDNALREMMKQLRAGVDASMGFVTKGAGYTAVAADKNYVIRFTGAYTLTLTAAATLGSGWYCYVQADGGAVTIDPNASETINGSATLTLPDGYSTLIWCDGTNFRALEDASTISAAIALKQDASGLTFSQFRLTKSGSNLLLSRAGGKYITINGVNETIPSAGVTLAPSGSSAGTTYNIYAYMSSGTMTTEYSTTAHATDSTTGVEIKSGDATRTLVGMARAVTGPAWADTVTQRFVISWANRKNIPLYNAFTADRTTSSTSVAEINTEIRCEFLTWADEAVDAVANAMAANAVGAGISIYGSVAFDAASDNDAFIEMQTISANYISVLPIRNTKLLSEGYHYATLGGGSSSGTTTWQGDTAGGRRTQLNVMIRG